MKMNEIIVSICCQTYNHVGYIEKAVESFLMQKTDFRFEILIRDDASTDGTTKIVQEYAFKFPELIKLLIYEENQFKKGVKPFPDTAKRAQGKYIAICEGDDYWTDPLKLQKQVDLMEQYSEATMCVALHNKFYQNNGEVIVQKNYSGRNYPYIYFDDLKEYFHTSTYLIRKQVLDLLMSKDLNLFLGDTSMRYLLIEEGPFVVLNDVVSSYRITNTGIWTSLSKHSQDLMHYNLFKQFRLYHVAKKRKYYAFNELIFSHSVIIHKIKYREYKGIVNLIKQHIWLMITMAPLFYFRFTLRKIKNGLRLFLRSFR